MVAVLPVHLQAYMPEFLQLIVLRPFSGEADDPSCLQSLRVNMLEVQKALESWLWADVLEAVLRP